MDKKIIVLFSGGIDSSVALAYLKQKGFDIYPFFVNHHQKPLEAERKATESITKILGTRSPFEAEVNLETIKSVSEDWKRFNIGSPARNMIFIGMALMYAAIIDADSIALGAVYGSGYPDNSIAFLNSVQTTGTIVLDRKIKIFSPFKDEKLTEVEVIKLGSGLGVPLEKTWSCFLPRLVQCGKCEKCKRRQERFQKAGIEDKTEYDSTDVTEEDLMNATTFV